jgi:hypothetical protein
VVAGAFREFSDGDFGFASAAGDRFFRWRLGSKRAAVLRNRVADAGGVRTPETM